MRLLLSIIGAQANPMLLRVSILALVTLQLVVHSFTGVTPIHNALVDAATATAEPFAVMLPTAIEPNFSYDSFASESSYRRIETLASGRQLPTSYHLHDLMVWPPNGIPTGRNTRLSLFTPMFAAVFSLLLMLVPPIERIGSRRSLAAMAATLIITLPFPFIVSFIPKFWHALASPFPSAPIAPIGVSSLGIGIAWSGVLVLYAAIYLKLRPLTAPREPTPDRCDACNYDLTNLDTCPECNTPRGVTPTRIKIRRRLLSIAPFALPFTLMCAPLWLTWIQAIR